jgi:hypothetical protein
MTSQRFNELLRRLAELKQHFLPADFDSTGLYEESVYEHTKAYRILAHAEFESFIEDRALDVVANSFNQWKVSGSASTALLGVVAFHDAINQMPDAFSETSQKKKFRDLATAIENAKNGYNRHVRTENHGIKTKNLVRMLLPLGLTEEDIDSEWLTITEAWATARGEVAHAAGKVQVRPDPQHELSTVTKILEGFRSLDESLDTK